MTLRAIKVGGRVEDVPHLLSMKVVRAWDD